MVPGEIHTVFALYPKACEETSRIWIVRGVMLETGVKT